MYLSTKFEKFLKSVNLTAYRKKYRPIKIVEMDLPPNIQAIGLLYKIYWQERNSLKNFPSYDDFYKRYFKEYKIDILVFQKKTGMCLKCFKKGLPARIYRTWASIITQIHAGYVAESVFGKGTVDASVELDHHGADFQVQYLGEILNYQVEKTSFSREVRQEKKTKDKIPGRFISIKYEVPSEDYFENPKRKDGKYRLPYLKFRKNKNLKRLQNGFIVFTPHIFEGAKKKIDKKLK